MTQEISKKGSVLTSASSNSGQVEAFLGQAKQFSAHRGRANILFGLDLTASRENTLTEARKATASMFQAIGEIGSVAMKFVYYRGLDECRASKDWIGDAQRLITIMENLSCVGGHTQIARLLGRALQEASQDKVGAVIFVGDHSEENPDDLIGLAGELKAVSVPVFIFHECADHDGGAHGATPTFKKIAEISGGAYCAFNKNSGLVLRELLLAIAAFSTAGHQGLQQMKGPQTPEAKALQRKLLTLPPPR